MLYDTDVLIVGAGPTGLMMGCQLLRFGIPFRIIEKQADRAQESRAFAIHAKSMEIFQNLGLAAEFLEKSASDPLVHLYINGKPKAEFKFGKIPVADTPFPSIYFLPQSTTEEILINYLEKYHCKVERQVSLQSFSQTASGVKATIKNEINGQIEEIACQYIIGCDGAHSTIRHLLNIPFVGAAYLQEFILVDADVKWSFPADYKFIVFFDKKGVFLHLPMGKNLTRNMLAEFSAPHKKDIPITVDEVEKLGQQITHVPLKLSNIIWMSRFQLHHRAVQQYQLDRAFLAGDAAHIHSPVGGQGMNTGLQDATNLAWKIALVIKNNSPSTLLKTYQLERQRIGEILLKTTDRVFGLLTFRNFMAPLLRQLLFPVVVAVIGRSHKLQAKIFLFISQLGIHYHKNQFIYENTVGADQKFLAGPQAGCRAPDAPVDSQSLFEIFKIKPFNVLFFYTVQQPENENKLKDLQSKYDWLSVHTFTKSPATQIIFDRYGISSSGNYFIRPDGYIGFRSYGNKIEDLMKYIELLMG